MSDRLAAGRAPDRNDPVALLEAARAGDRVALPRLLSLVERGGASARQVAALTYRSPDLATTVGITGAPGAGKSTLTDRLITAVRRDGGTRVAVLAVDPSSPFSGGAILGDRVRMQGHSLDDGVFIRSMATRGISVAWPSPCPTPCGCCRSPGFRSCWSRRWASAEQEVEVASATDTTVVVVNPGWGDAIQANKAGLLEIADVFVVNKADRSGAAETRRDLELMLELTGSDDWRPPIVETVASTGRGVDELWAAIEGHRARLAADGLLEPRRRQRLERELRRIVVAQVEQRITELSGGDAFARLTDAVAAGRVDPYEAVDHLLWDAMPPRGAGGRADERTDR